MSLISDVLTGGVGTVIKSVTDLASDLITTDKERLAAENEAKRIDADLEKSYLADTDSARKHDADVQESEHASFLSKNVAYWIDLFIVSATFGMAYMILFKEIPPANKEIFYTTFGSLITLCMTVVNFHRGSSMRSQSKDATIAALSANK
jgi:hypothetical protein